MSTETEARLKQVMEQCRGKELFPEAMKRARVMFAGLTPQNYTYVKHRGIIT